MSNSTGTEDAQELYRGLCSVDPLNMAEMRYQYQQLHEVACAEGHSPGCVDPMPPDDDWNGWVDRLAGVRALVWWRYVAEVLRENGEAPDLESWDTSDCTEDKAPPDTTSHLYRKF